MGSRSKKGYVLPANRGKGKDEFPPSPKLLQVGLASRKFKRRRGKRGKARKSCQ